MIITETMQRNTMAFHLLLTIAVPTIPKGPSSYTSDPNKYFAWQVQNAQYVDWMNLMSYDYHGAFSATTGVNSPMQGGSQHEATTDSVQNYLGGGVPAAKLALGMPTYEHNFAGVKRTRLRTGKNIYRREGMGNRH